MRKSKYFLVGLITLFVIGSSLSYAAEVKAIKFANITSLSGSGAPWGLACKRGLEMAAKDVGTFVIAGNSYKFEVIDYDHKYSPVDALSALNKAIFSENIRFGHILGAGIHPPIFPLLREQKFLDFFCGTAGKNITNPTNPTVFRTIGSADQCIIAFTEEFYNKFKITRVATLVINDELGKTDADLLRQIHKDPKIKASIVAEEFYERGTTDFYPALKRVLAKKPDVLFTNGTPTGLVGTIAKQSRELGFTKYIYNPDGVLDAKVLWDMAGKASDNILCPRVYPEPPTKIFSEIERKYREEYKEEMMALVPEVYPVVPWLIEAMKRANSVDNEKVLAALPDTPYKDHPMGPASWGGDKFYGIKRQIIYPLPLAILQDAKWKQVMMRDGRID